MATVLVLVSTASSSMPLQKAQRKIADWLQIKKLAYEEVDGANREFAELRNKLWDIAGQRVYPLVFIKDGENYTFVGDYDAVEYLMESETFDSQFTNVTRVA
eukprot:TRINITY_DN15426_c0_g1_i1.p3 TRINITY_DN15426_c0_g1~~TRINITY_DN15426_c0_g1_i1.p3  ORF type:complete len:117 (-),score=61.90 TRINITY_DN15426_c0_g1_i1:79-384(-)